MTRAIFVISGFCLLLASCTQRMICPAYQSAFIYDKDELRKKFSYFQQDTIPKVYTASKTKYLIAVPTPYRKKVRNLQTVPVRKVMVAVPDSISGKESPDSVINADLDRAARSVIDSTIFVDEPQPDTMDAEGDGTYVISKDREVRVLRYNMPDSLEFDTLRNRYVPQKPAYYVDEVGFNTEQDNYMWYLRHSLILPDVRIAKMQAAEKKLDKDEKKSKGKKGLFGFFKNLFGKQKTQDVDSAEYETDPDQEQFDFIDTTAQEEPVRTRQPSEKKKGLFQRADNETNEGLSDQPAGENASKKKRKKKGDPAKPRNDKKKEEGDDGF